MRSSLDCIPCFVRQAIDAARAVSDDPALHEATVREMLSWIAGADLDQAPPSFAQHIHRRLREMVGDDDPYHLAKQQHNAMALRLLPRLSTLVEEATDPLDIALRLAAAGNAIDLGVTSAVDDSDLERAIDHALQQPLVGDQEGFRKALENAEDILYLADNAGEIAFDRLLVEQIGPSRVTVAVRGAPVLNDATRADAAAVGLDRIVTVIDNGSDAPGTVLADCSEEFRQHFADADLILAKGQGNYESLSEEPRDIFFLFKAKCDVVARELGVPKGTHLLTRGPGHSGTSTAKT